MLGDRNPKFSPAVCQDLLFRAAMPSYLPLPSVGVLHCISEGQSLSSSVSQQSHQ